MPLIIPDIHLRFRLVDQILKHEQPEQAIFLGDHFDNFNDNPDINRQAALWIKSRMATHPNDIWLWGNHDLSYAFNSRFTSCSGYTHLKHTLINDVLRPTDWERFKFYHWLGDNWLISHAGLHPCYVIDETTIHGYKSLDAIKAYLIEEDKKAQEAIRRSEGHWFFCAGRARGGVLKKGGLTWCDFNHEFNSIPGVNQIFGHTNMYASAKENNWKNTVGELHQPDSRNYCLDTQNMYYALWCNNEITLKFVPDELNLNKK